MLGVKPHLSVENWLQKLDLPLYAPIFKSYNGVEDMLHLSEQELKDMGIRNGSHRARIATSLAVLKEKYHRAQKSRSPNSSTMTLKLESKSHGSVSPLHQANSETMPSGIQSWPSSSMSNLARVLHPSQWSSVDVIGDSDQELRKALEWELGLDKSDLRSHAWYHGTILRQKAESLVVKDGDFLVRDFISQPGDFVITCKWNGVPLHFIIKKIVLQPSAGYGKVQYCFENVSFDSIHDFITHYVGSQCPLSAATGVVLQNPINRSKPLSYYFAHDRVQSQLHYAAKKLENFVSTRTVSPEAPGYYKSNHNTLSHAIPESADEETGDLSTTHEPKENFSPIHWRKLVKVSSDPSLNPNAERKTFENRPNSGTFTCEMGKGVRLMEEKEVPPPKPSRVPSKRWASKPLVVKKERRNTPPTPFQEVTNIETFSSDNLEVPLRPGLPIPYKRMMSGETRFSFLDHPSVSSDGSLSDAETLEVPFTMPKLNQGSCFHPASFSSPSWISINNKPLEAAVLQKIQDTLINESSKTLASHLTRVDLEVSKNFEEEDLGLGVTCGFELMFLPQGEQLVTDLLERTHCLKILVATTVLTCTSEEERIQVLGKWIDIAIDAKNAYGNMYGFTGIMLGLTLPQVSNLHYTWQELRQLHTDKTFTFETKLRPVFKAMQIATSQVAPNTSIPYIFSILSILKHHTKVMKAISQQIAEEDLNLGLSAGSNEDFGLQVLEDHMKASRSVLLHWPEFWSNADLTLRKIKYNSILLDLFRTEFHMRLLWGSKGAVVDSEERHKKFANVLDVLFKMYQHRFQHH